MKDLLQRPLHAWQARTARERLILAAAACVLPVLLADTLVWYPWRVQMKALAARQDQAQAELGRLQSLPQVKPVADDVAQRQVEHLQRQLTDTEQQVQDVRSRLPTPETMVQTLKALTAATGQLRVTGLQSLPVEAVGPTAGGEKLYRHRFELSLRGTYAEIAEQLHLIETEWPTLRWSLMELDGRRHPSVTARLVVFTVSEQATWIRL